MPPLSPRSPQRMGFLPLNNGRSDTSMDGDIPLTKVATASSTGGARRQDQTLEEMPTTASEEKKAGLFHRKSKAQKTAGRRKQVRVLGEAGRKGTDGEDITMNAMGRLYHKIVGFSVVTRYLVYVVPVAFVLAIPLAIIPATGNFNDTHVGGNITDSKGDTTSPRLFDLFLWIEISWCSLWVGKIVAHLLPPVFMFFCGVVSSGVRKYASVLRALEIPLSLFFWALASYLTFKFMFLNDNYEWISVIKKILGSLSVSSTVFLGEKTIVQLISITYHQRSFANRIKDSKREVYLLGLLYDASRTLFPMYCHEFAEEDYVINDSIEMMLKPKTRRGHKKSGSMTPLNLIHDVGRFGDKITSVFGNLASEITGKQVFNPNSAHSVVVEALEKPRSSEAMARRIWMSFVCEGNDSLSSDDIVEVLGASHRNEAEECFEAIDADQNGDISLDEMVRKVVEIGTERKAISNSMKDIGQALSVFDSVLLFVVVLIVIFVFLSFFQSSFLTTLTTAGTALLSLSFVFAVTTQEFLGSCIFLFVKHPYDVGDRVDITGSEKEQLIVEKISLLYTVFTRIDKMQVVQVPNIALNNLWIENVTRSKAMKEVIDVNISYDTTFEDVEILRLEMEKFVRHPDNARDFQQDVAIGVGGIGDLDKMTLKIVIKHKSNWHNDAVRATRRSKFMCALALALKKVPIYGPGGGAEPLGGPLNPAYNVTVDDIFAATARAKADQEKEDKRMVPLLPQRMGSSASKAGMSEVNAAAELNMQPAVVSDTAIGGYNRDDEDTLGNPTRDPSADRERNENIEQIRHELLKRENTRGRRKAGDSVPPVPLSTSSPSFTVTQHGDQTDTFDMESQMEMGTYSSSYGAGPSATAQSYNLYPQSGSLPPLQQSSTNLPHPLQSSPAGARPRGQSVSKAREEQERQQRQQQQR